MSLFSKLRSPTRIRILIVLGSLGVAAFAYLVINPSEPKSYATVDSFEPNAGVTIRPRAPTEEEHAAMRRDWEIARQAKMAREALLTDGVQAASFTLSKPNTIGAYALDLIGLPSGEMKITGSSGEQITASSIQWTIDANGQIRDATPGSSKFLKLMILIAAAMAASHFASMAISTTSWHAVRYYNVHYGSPHCCESGPMRFWGAVASGSVVVGSVVTFDYTYWPVVLLVVACFGSMALDNRQRLRLMLAVGVFSAAVSLFNVETVAPHPSIASSYGPIGAMSWDIALLASLLLAVIAWIFMKLASRLISRLAYRPGAPLVQNVRIVQ